MPIHWDLCPVITRNSNNLSNLSLTRIFLFLELTAVASVQEKAEAAIPITTMSPPESNATFLGGTTWCVALSGVPQADLQNALDWACGLGMADCKPIQEGGACFDPDTLVSHASYAFNNYYQQNGNSEIACNFGGTAALTKADPSTYGLSFTYKLSSPPRILTTCFPFAIRITRAAKRYIPVTNFTRKVLKQRTACRNLISDTQNPS